jgi:hypothetical protein
VILEGVALEAGDARGVRANLRGLPVLVTRRVPHGGVLLVALAWTSTENPLSVSHVDVDVE